MGTCGWTFLACLGLCLLVVLSSSEPVAAETGRVLASGAHHVSKMLTSTFMPGKQSCCHSCRHLVSLSVIEPRCCAGCYATALACQE